MSSRASGERSGFVTTEAKPGAYRSFRATRLLRPSGYSNKIAWYENNGNGTFSSQKVISTDANGANSVYAADLTGTGDPDVVSASSGDDKIARYENIDETLRVELAGFDATVDGGTVTLTWQTASETNNAGFRTQRCAGERGGKREGEHTGAWTFVSEPKEDRHKEKLDVSGPSSAGCFLRLSAQGVTRMQKLTVVR